MQLGAIYEKNKVSVKEIISVSEIPATLMYMDIYDINSENNEQGFEVDCTILGYEKMMTMPHN